MKQLIIMISLFSIHINLHGATSYIACQENIWEKESLGLEQFNQYIQDFQAHIDINAIEERPLTHQEISSGLTPLKENLKRFSDVVANKMRGYPLGSQNERKGFSLFSKCYKLQGKVEKILAKYLTQKSSRIEALKSNLNVGVSRNFLIKPKLSKESLELITTEFEENIVTFEYEKKRINSLQKSDEFIAEALRRLHCVWKKYCLDLSQKLTKEMGYFDYYSRLENGDFSGMNKEDTKILKKCNDLLLLIRDLENT